MQNHDNSRQILRLVKKFGDNSQEQQVLFTNRNLKYEYDYALQKFKAVEFGITELTTQEIKDAQGLSKESVRKSQEYFGKCEISFELPKFFEFMFEQLTSPVNFLIYFSIVLFFAEKLFVFAIGNLIVLILTMIILYVFIRISKTKLLKYAKSSQRIQVERDGTQTAISSEEIVPGDIIFLEKNTNVPCDCVLIDGEILLDENTLTGEATPITKFEIENSEVKFEYNLF